MFATITKWAFKTGKHKADECKLYIEDLDQDLANTKKFPVSAELSLDPKKLKQGSSSGSCLVYN